MAAPRLRPAGKVVTVPPNYARQLVDRLYEHARDEDWAKFESRRGQMFKLWLYGFLTEDFVVPFRDLWSEPEVFHEERQRLQRQMARGRLPEMLPGADSAAAEQARLEDWFIGEVQRAAYMSVDEHRAWLERQGTELLRSLFPGPQTRPVGPDAKVAAPKRERKANPNAITQTQFANVYGAVAFAQYRGLPLNTHVSVTWSTVGLESDEDIRSAHLKLVEAMRKFIVVTLRLPQYHFWVLERSVRRGLHTHLMVHLPKANRQDLEKTLVRAVETITGKVPVQTAETKTVFVRPLRTFQEQWHVFNYLMKGVYRDEASLSRRERQRYREFLKSLTEAPRFTGVIKGQRVRVSRALDVEVRRQACFADRWSQGDRDPAYLYVDYEHVAEVDRLVRSCSV